MDNTGGWMTLTYGAHSCPTRLRLPCVVSCEGPNGPTLKRPFHTIDTGKVDLRCVFDNGASIRPTSQISIRIPSSCTDTAFPPCGSSSGPSGGRTSCRFSHSRHTYRNASSLSSGPNVGAHVWVWQVGGGQVGRLKSLDSGFGRCMG